MLRIAKKFLASVDVHVPVQDLTISGSNAGYRYTPNSDIDLHILVNFGRIECDEPVHELFDKATRLWKEQHDIRIHDIPVEVYVQDTREPHVSDSVYSLLNRAWLTRPRAKSADYDRAQVAKWVSRWENIIDHARSHGDYETLRGIMDLLKRYRKLGLRSSRGELSTENLVFKSLRNAGEIGRLVQSMSRQQDRDLGLPEDTGLRY